MSAKFFLTLLLQRVIISFIKQKRDVKGAIIMLEEQGNLSIDSEIDCVLLSPPQWISLLANTGARPAPPTIKNAVTTKA